MNAFIFSRLACCNVLLLGFPQNVQAAALVPCAFQDFKVNLLVYKYPNGFGPSYLFNILLSYEPLRSLKSSGIGLGSTSQNYIWPSIALPQPLSAEQPTGEPQGCKNC